MSLPSAAMKWLAAPSFCTEKGTEVLVDLVTGKQTTCAWTSNLNPSDFGRENTPLCASGTGQGNHRSNVG